MARRQYGNLDWDKVIFALLKYKTHSAAAAALGVSRVTVWRYTLIPEFHRRWLHAQASVYSKAKAELEAEACEAAKVMIQIMKDPQAKPADRLRAAEYILGQRPTGLPLDDIDLEDFDQDSLGLDPENPMEADLSLVEEPIEARRSGQSRDQPAQPLPLEQRASSKPAGSARRPAGSHSGSTCCNILQHSATVSQARPPQPRTIPGRRIPISGSPVFCLLFTGRTVPLTSYFLWFLFGFVQLTGKSCNAVDIELRIAAFRNVLQWFLGLLCRAPVRYEDTS